VLLEYILAKEQINSLQDIISGFYIVKAAELQQKIMFRGSYTQLKFIRHR
jgi:hypothetical protein